MSDYTTTAILIKKQPKTCPFCGWGTIVDGGWFGRYKCECLSCGASTRSFKKWDDAVTAWNRRSKDGGEA